MRRASSTTHQNALAAEGVGARVRRCLNDSTLQKGVISVVDQALVSGGNFAASVAIGRLCSQSELGVYALALSVVFFARGFQQQVLSAPYMIYCQRRSGRAAASYAGSSFFHQATFVIFVSGAFAVLAAATWFFTPRLSLTLCVLLLGAPLILLREQIRSWSFAHLEMKASLMLDACVAFFQVGGLAALAYLGLLNAASALVVLAGGCAAASLGWALLRRPTITVCKKRAWLHWRRNWTFAKWTLASHVVGCSTPYLMPWVVVVFSGEAATGMLAACHSLVGLSNTFVIGLSNFLCPRTARAYADGGVGRMRRVLRTNAILFSATMGVFCLIAWLLGGPIAQLLYGPAFAGAGPIIGVLALAMWANSLSMTAGNGLWAMERPAGNFRADLATLVTSMVVSLVLTSPWGAFGAAVGTLAGVVVGVVVRSYSLIAWMNVEQRELSLGQS